MYPGDAYILATPHHVCQERRLCLPGVGAEIRAYGTMSRRGVRRYALVMGRPVATCKPSSRKKGVRRYAPTDCHNSRISQTPSIHATVEPGFAA
jgi:hypothetical protein